jgi:uncharacterized membrane protein SpoIIM required for sporulation
VLTRSDPSAGRAFATGVAAFGPLAIERLCERDRKLVLADTARPSHYQALTDAPFGYGSPEQPLYLFIPDQHRKWHISFSLAHDNLKHVPKGFLESRVEKWKRLEELTECASQVKLAKLSGEQLREFGRLYRRAAADLAIAREEVRDQRLVNYLNHLVGRAHACIYRNESSGFGAIVSFFLYEFPAVFRKTFGYTLAAFLVFLASASFALTVCLLDENFADRINPQLKRDIAAHRNWTEAINQANPLASTSIQTNNITVTFFAFAGGVIAGVGTLWVMAQNGLLLGVVMGLCIRYRFWDIPIFVAGHGVIELTAIFIAGGAGLLIGKALLIPEDLRRADAIVSNGLLAIKLVVGCIPMLIIAGLIEGFISPAHVPHAYKFLTSAVSALAMAVYFLRPDLRYMKQ